MQIAQDGVLIADLLKNESQQLPAFCYHSLSLVEDFKNVVEFPHEKPKIKCNEEQFQSDLDRALYLSNLRLRLKISIASSWSLALIGI